MTYREPQSAPSAKDLAQRRASLVAESQALRESISERDALAIEVQRLRVWDDDDPAAASAELFRKMGDLARLQATRPHGLQEEDLAPFRQELKRWRPNEPPPAPIIPQLDQVPDVLSSDEAFRLQAHYEEVTTALAAARTSLADEQKRLVAECPVLLQRRADGMVWSEGFEDALDHIESIIEGAGTQGGSSKRLRNVCLAVGVLLAIVVVAVLMR